MVGFFGNAGPSKLGYFSLLKYFGLIDVNPTVSHILPSHYNYNWIHFVTIRIHHDLKRHCELLLFHWLLSFTFKTLENPVFILLCLNRFSSFFFKMWLAELAIDSYLYSFTLASVLILQDHSLSSFTFFDIILFHLFKGWYKYL